MTALAKIWQDSQMPKRPKLPSIAIALVLLFVGLATGASSAVASTYDGCGFGSIAEDYDPESGDPMCAPMNWTLDDSSDAFSKSFNLQQDADEVNSSGSIDIYYHLIFGCEAKKLSVIVYSAPLDMYPRTALNGSGSGQVKFDSGKVSTFAYRHLSNYSGFYLTSPKTFAQSLLNAKTKVAFKVSNMDGPLVMTFAKADLKDYLTKFSKAGCSLGKVSTPKSTQSSSSKKSTSVTSTKSNEPPIYDSAQNWLDGFIKLGACSQVITSKNFPNPTTSGFSQKSSGPSPYRDTIAKCSDPKSGISDAIITIYSDPQSVLTASEKVHCGCLNVPTAAINMGESVIFVSAPQGAEAWIEGVIAKIESGYGGVTERSYSLS